MKAQMQIASCTFLMLWAVPAQADTTMSIPYGVVQETRTVESDSRHAGGALAGGLLAAAVTGPRTRHRGLKIAGSAAAGGAIQGAATSGVEQAYNVALVDGGAVVVTTEQQDIRQGDCVAVALGRYANIQRVGSYQCEAARPYEAPAHHAQAASACDDAKAELSAAETDDAVDIAVKKVRALCEH